MNLLYKKLTLLLFAILTACSGSPASNIPPTPSAAPESVTQPPTDGEMRTYLDRLTGLGFSGSVLIAHRGDVLFSAGYGEADPSQVEPITADTIFNIGSNTKPFTAAAILKLQDQKRLSLEDALPAFFEEVPTDKQGITVHQLLTHSAGLNHSGIFEGDFEQVERDEAVRRILESELLFRPGSESSYSDAGYILLAAIIEKTSGQTFPDYIRMELLEPAGMASTGWWGNDPALTGKSYASGTSPEGEPNGSGVTFPGPFWSIQGAGGMVSTVSDLYRWHQAVQAGDILSPEATADYAAGHFTLGENEQEGYGWVVAQPFPGRQVRVSAGGTPQLGHENIIQWWTPEDWVIIVSTNNRAFLAGEVARQLGAIAFGDEYGMPPQVVSVTGNALARLEGKYHLAEGGTLIVTQRSGQLLLTMEDQAGFELLFPAISPEHTEANRAMQAAVVQYLNTAKDGQLGNWITKNSQELGTFKTFSVIGTALSSAVPEPVTYVAFEFERGTRLSWWIVNEAGALQAALLDVEMPSLALWPQSPTEFVSFSISQPLGIDRVQFEETPQGLRLTVTQSDGSSLPAEKEL